MTRADLAKLVDEADDGELPELVGDLAAAQAKALARLTTPRPAPPSPVAADAEGGDYTPIEIAEILSLFARDGKTPDPTRVYTLTRRSYDPLPSVQYGRRALRIPRRPFWEWKRRQGEKRRG